MNGGAFTYNGVSTPAPNRNLDSINAAILVENGGTFMVASDGMGNNNGSGLLFNGAYTDSNSGKTASVYMKSGSIQLSQLGLLQCTQNYYQSGGILETMDALPFSLSVGANGTVNVMGGSLKLGQGVMQPQYGSLTVSCTTLNFAGTYAPKINGPIAGQCDRLNVQGALNLNTGTSTLQVTVKGNLGVQGTEQWVVVTSTGGPITDFDTPPVGLTGAPNAPQNGYYQLEW